LRPVHFSGRHLDDEIASFPVSYSTNNEVSSHVLQHVHAAEDLLLSSHSYFNRAWNAKMNGVVADIEAEDSAMDQMRAELLSNAANVELLQRWGQGLCRLAAILSDFPAPLPATTSGHTASLSVPNEKRRQQSLRYLREGRSKLLAVIGASAARVAVSRLVISHELVFGNTCSPVHGWRPLAPSPSSSSSTSGGPTLKSTAASVATGNTWRVPEFGKAIVAYKWSLFLRGNPIDAALPFIDFVTFELHPSFYPSRITLWNPPFVVERQGWGTFRASITVGFKAPFETKRLNLEHDLCLDPSGVGAIQTLQLRLE
jgi:hypothetical protein